MVCTVLKQTASLLYFWRASYIDFKSKSFKGPSQIILQKLDSVLDQSIILNSSST